MKTLKAIVVKNEFGMDVLFPEVPATTSPTHMMAWDPESGHGAASEDWVMEQEVVADAEAEEIIKVYKRQHGVAEDIQLMKRRFWGTWRRKRAEDILAMS